MRTKLIALVALGAFALSAAPAQARIVNPTRTYWRVSPNAPLTTDYVACAAFGPRRAIHPDRIHTTLFITAAGDFARVRIERAPVHTRVICHFYPTGVE